MIVNIPVFVDENALKEMIEKNLETYIRDVVKEEVRKGINSLTRADACHDPNNFSIHRFYEKRFNQELMHIISQYADKILKDREGEIIADVCNRVSKRFINKKKLNEAINITINGAEIEVTQPEV